MFYIGICDDEKMQRQYISELCERFFQEYPQEHKIIEFESGEEMLTYPGAEMQPDKLTSSFYLPYLFPTT